MRSIKLLFINLLSIIIGLSTITSIFAQGNYTSLKGKKILFVYGGWDGHEPVETKDIFVPWLISQGAEVRLSDNLDIYTDLNVMNNIDLIIQTWTMGEISAEQEKGLTDAVKRGVGLAGWHGGIGDSFRNSTEYQFMVGGQFVSHPGGVIPFNVKICNKNDEITRGLKDFKMTSEQYFMHVDPNVNILATTTFTGEHAPWIKGTVMPVIWKKMYGQGKVFYSSLGHDAKDFTIYEVLEIMKRGINWAASDSPISMEISRCNEAKQPVDYVNPYLGNISHLLVPTFPTIHLPHSMLRVYPERGDFTGDVLNGLPIVVTSHRGSSAFNLSPFYTEREELTPVIKYSYDNEKITPYKYHVYLDEEDITVDYTLSHQSAIYKINFGNEDKNGNSTIIINSRNGELKWDGSAISGYQNLANNTKVYLYLVPELLPVSASVLTDGILKEGHSAFGRNASLVLKWPKDYKELTFRYGISFIDEDQARRNMEREVADKSFNEIAETSRNIWNDELGKIQVSGGTEDDRFLFYTSLYRTYERPVSISEDGRYFSAFDGKVHDDFGRPFYTDDWIWDSYRAHHPLRILIDAKREEDILNSFVLMSEQMENLWLPTFPEITGDSRRMNSNHGVISILDAHIKGLGNFDLKKAYMAGKGAIMDKTLAPWSGSPSGELDKFYHEKGYIPALREGEEETIPEVHSFERRQPVAVTLGTSYDQWSLAQLAKSLGLKNDYEYFMNASFNYRNLFNSETGFFHPKDKDGKFIQPFDYRYDGGMGARGFYGENNGWIYRWDVPHNIPDLIDLMGGKKVFVDNLDNMFREPLGKSKYDFYSQLPDHTGNVGQFSMANEPSLHIPYLYNYAGEPWKTQKRVRTLIKQWFRNDLMGIPGDEDGGGLSSFVVFSQMGFYPVTPGTTEYTIGSPFFDHVKINLGNGNFFEIETINNSPENKYIQSATLNGKPFNKVFIDHFDIMKGGKIVFEMGNKAKRDYFTTD